jgi:hypothetical protein
MLKTGISVATRFITKGLVDEIMFGDLGNTLKAASKVHRLQKNNSIREQNDKFYVDCDWILESGYWRRCISFKIPLEHPNTRTPAHIT